MLWWKTQAELRYTKLSTMHLFILVAVELTSLVFGLEAHSFQGEIIGRALSSPLSGKESVCDSNAAAVLETLLPSASNNFLSSNFMLACSHSQACCYS